MTGSDFELHVAGLIRILGYEIDFRNQPLLGKEVDILASGRIPGLKYPFRLAVECKYRSSGGRVSNDDVIAFGNHVDQLHRNGVVDRGLLVSNVHVSQKGFAALEGAPGGILECATPESLLRRIIPHPEFIETVISQCCEMLCVRAQTQHVRPRLSEGGDEFGYFVWPSGYSVRGKRCTSPIEDRLRGWLADPSRRLLLILGDPGAGKTWLSIALVLLAARACKEASSKPMPFFVPARGWRLNEPFHMHASRQMLELFGTAIQAPDAFKHLVESRQALVVLDGLDELQGELEPAQRRDVWPAVLRASHENKFVVTCRSRYAADNLIDHDDVITLTDFAGSDIREYVERAFPEESERIREDLDSQKQLRRLCKRAAFATLACEILADQEVPLSAASDVGELYKLYTSRVMERDVHSVGSGDPEVLRDTHCALAWMMHVEHTTRVLEERLRSEIGKHLTHAEKSPMLALRAIQRSSLVHVTQRGYVSFVSMLFKEYFLAVRIVERLRANRLQHTDLDERIDSDVLSGFLKSVLSDRDTGPLLTLLQHEDQPWHQYFAAYYLSRLGAQGISTVLLQKYHSTDDRRVKREFALALANLGEMETFEQYFRPVLLENRELAEENNRWIEHFFDEDRDAAVRACAGRLTRVHNYPGRAMLLHYLGQYGHAAHRPLLEGFLNDERPFVRDVAAAALREYEDRVTHRCVSEGGAHIPTRTLLLDFDGVLVDTLAEHVGAWNDALRQIGVSVDSREIALSEGMHSAAVIEDIARDRRITLQAGQAEQILEAKNREFLETASISLTEAGQQLLTTAHSWGSRVAIVTASERSVVETALNDLPAYISPTIVSPESPASSKPRPDPYLRAAEELSASPEDCIVIENSPPGIEAARAAGIPCVAVTSTLNATDLRGATDIASDLTGVLHMLRVLRQQGQPYPDATRLSEEAVAFVEKSLLLSYGQFGIASSLHAALFEAVRSFLKTGDRSLLSQRTSEIHDGSFVWAYEKYQEEARPKWIAEIARGWLTGRNVVDVGCGKNRLGRYLLQEYGDTVKNVVGTDVTPLRASDSGVKFQLHDPDAPYGIPCKDASADTVIMANMLHHVPLFDQVTMLKDCGRILAPGGRLILIEDGYSPTDSPKEEWEDLGVTFARLDDQTIHASLSLLDWLGTYFGAGAVSMPRPFSFRRLEDWRVVMSFVDLHLEHSSFLGFPRGKLHLNPQVLLVANKSR